MAFATTDYNIRPEDGWVLVATNPTFCRIKPYAVRPWEVAITAGGAPAAGVYGYPLGRDEELPLESFETQGALTGEVYIRVTSPVSNTDKVRFGVITG